MELYNIIYGRKSIRKYSDENLSSKLLEQILNMANSSQRLYDIDMQVHLAEDGKSIYNILKGIVGNYGKVYAPHYLVVTSEHKEGCFENVGFSLEPVILKLTSMGIGTCWVGIPVNEEGLKNIVNYGDNQHHVILIAFGYPLDKDRLLRTNPYQRKQLSEIIEGQTDEMLTKILDSARVAPSAMNSQPWRFVVDGDIIHLYIVNSSILTKLSNNHLAIMNRIDAGIALSHIKIAAEQYDKKIDIKKVELPLKNGHKYITSIEIF